MYARSGIATALEPQVRLHKSHTDTLAALRIGLAAALSAMDNEEFLLEAVRMDFSQRTNILWFRICQLVLLKFPALVIYRLSPSNYRLNIMFILSTFKKIDLLVFKPI